MPRERPRYDQAYEAMGGRRGSPASSESSGTAQERDAVDAALYYGSVTEVADTTQAPQTNISENPYNGYAFEIQFNRQQMAATGFSARETIAHEGTHGVNTVSGWQSQGSVGWNMNLPEEPAQQEPSYTRQTTAMSANFDTLIKAAQRDYERGRISKDFRKRVEERANYAQGRGVEVEYGTVVNELMERLRKHVPDTKRRHATRTYDVLDKMRTANFNARMSPSQEQVRVEERHRGPLHRAGMPGIPTGWAAPSGPARGGSAR